jgi:enediyne biosynthesis protein E4
MNTLSILRILSHLLSIVIVGTCVGCTTDKSQPMGSAARNPENSDVSQASKSDLSGASNESDLNAELPSDPVLLEEVVSKGLSSAVYRNGEEAGVSSILESLGGGVGIHDFDLDGMPDLFVPGGGDFLPGERVTGLNNYLLRGLGNFDFADVSSAAHMGASKFYTHGVAIADYDNDGFPDVLFTGYGGLQLWHNQGDGTFAEQAAVAGLLDNRWSSSAAWADIDNDGSLDLYVCHYVNWSFEHHPVCPGPKAGQREICSPRDFESLSDTLYLSDGAGAFRDASQAWGLVEGGKGLGVVIGDATGDGLVDIYVANDTTENFFYRNAGDHLEEVSGISGVAVDDEGIPNGSMGVELADITGDLRPDLWAANYERESFALYRNEGEGLFLHVSRATGITALGGLFVGFGSCALDADGDSDLDVAIANGHVIKYPLFSQRMQVPLLLMNNNNRFSRRTFPGEHYFRQLHEGRGLARGDIDRDGHFDLVFARVNAPVAIVQSTLDSDHRSLSVRLIGRRSNREALGAQATLQCDQGRQMRALNGGGSYLSSNQPLLLFEIPETWQPQSLSIRWPDGGQDVWPLTPEQWSESQPHTLTILESTDK